MHILGRRPAANGSDRVSHHSRYPSKQVLRFLPTLPDTMRLSSTCPSGVHLVLLFVCFFFSIYTTEGALDFATGRVKMSILRRRITQAEIASFSYELCFDRCTNPNCGGIMWHSREWPPGKDWKGEAKCMGDCEKPITELVTRAAQEATQGMPDDKWKPDEFFNIICEYRCKVHFGKIFQSLRSKRKGLGCIIQ